MHNQMKKIITKEDRFTIRKNPQIQENLRWPMISTKCQSFMLTFVFSVHFSTDLLISCDCFRSTGNSAAHRQKHAVLKQSHDIKNKTSGKCMKSSSIMTKDNGIHNALALMREIKAEYRGESSD